MFNYLSLSAVQLVLQSKVQQFLCSGLLGLLLVSLSTPGLALTVEEIPNSREKSGGWVTDEANLLSPKTEIDINRLVSNLETKNGVEVAVVTVPETRPSASPKAFATELFNHWGIGKEDQDNGVLLLFSKADRRVEIETGDGIEAVLPDTKVGNIISQSILPRLKQDDFDGGTFAGTKAVVQTLEQIKPLPVQAQSNPQAVQSEGLLNFIFGAGLLVCVVMAAYAFKDVMDTRTDDSDDETREQYATRKRVPTPKPESIDIRSGNNDESDIQQSQTRKQNQADTGNNDRRLSFNTSEQTNFLGTGYSSSELTAAATWAAFVSSSSNSDTDSNTRSESESAGSDSSSNDSGSSRYSDSSSSSSSSYSDNSSSSSDFGGGSSGGGGAGDSW